MARTRLYPPSVDPGFPTLTATPDGWTRKSFGDVVEVVERPIKLTPTSRYRLITAKRNREGITLRSESLGSEILTKTQFETKTGDFVISRRQIIHGACGVVPPALDGAVVSNEYSTLRTRPSLLMDYLRYFSHSPYFQRTCFHSSHGVDVEKMIFKIDEWLSRPMDLPPLGEQRKIAAILSSVDEAIAATQAVIDQLGVVKKAMMAELLTRGLPGRHTRFKQTAIGEVPEEWEVVRLEECLREPIRNGYSPVCPSTSTGAWIVHLGAVTAHGFNSNAVKPAPLHDSRVDVTRLEVGDLLLSRSNTRERVGLVGVYRGAPSVCFYPDLLMRLRVGPSLLVDFLESVLISPRARAYMASCARGTSESMVKINRGIVANLSIPIPRLDEQQEIVDTTLTITERIQSETVSLKALTNLKSALMSVLLAGEVRVQPDEAP